MEQAQKNFKVTIIENIDEKIAGYMVQIGFSEVLNKTPPSPISFDEASKILDDRDEFSRILAADDNEERNVEKDKLSQEDLKKILADRFEDLTYEDFYKQSLINRYGEIIKIRGKEKKELKAEAKRLYKLYDKDYKANHYYTSISEKLQDISEKILNHDGFYNDIEPKKVSSDSKK